MNFAFAASCTRPTTATFAAKQAAIFWVLPGAPHLIILAPVRRIPVHWTRLGHGPFAQAGIGPYPGVFAMRRAKIAKVCELGA